MSRQDENIKPTGIREDIPISTHAVQRTLSTDRPEPRGSYSKVGALAEDEHRLELGQKDKYPLRVGSYETPDNISNEEKERRAQVWAGEQDESGQRRDMNVGFKTTTGNWQDTNIPYTPLAPEKIDESTQERK